MHARKGYSSFEDCTHHTGTGCDALLAVCANLSAMTSTANARRGAMAFSPNHANAQLTHALAALLREVVLNECGHTALLTKCLTLSIHAHQHGCCSGELEPDLARYWAHWLQEFRAHMIHGTSHGHLYNACRSIYTCPVVV